mgnify:CR=1 FL=1
MFTPLQVGNSLASVAAGFSATAIGYSLTTVVGLLLPVSLAGMGTRDAALLYLSRGLIEPPALLASSIVYTFLGYFLMGALGLPFLDALTRRDGGSTISARKS